MHSNNGDTTLYNLDLQVLNQFSHRPFPEVAGALRATAHSITQTWKSTIRAVLPQLRHLTGEQLRDSTPQILLAIADAMASEDPGMISGLIAKAPAQGLSRLALRFDVTDVMQEDRLLRAIMVQQIEDYMGRRLDIPESTALHAAVDLMLQQSVIALVDEQKVQLRAAAEVELKFVSYLSHDLSNNLNGISLWLDVFDTELSSAGTKGIGNAQACVAMREALTEARRSINDTAVGMRRMLEHERLRMSGDVLPRTKVDLHDVVTQVVRHLSPEAANRGIALSVEVRAGAIVDSDAELLVIVLQNLVGNGLKYGGGGQGGGTVRIGGEAVKAGGGTLWVADDGKGIAQETFGRIFLAFRRGAARGQPGVGLGLAIALEAARLMGATLSVSSELGTGSTFFLTLPSGGETSEISQR